MAKSLFPIPIAAQTTSTQFRWSQTATSGPTWDFWGIDNVNISTCAGYSTIWNGGSITGYTADTVTVNPTQSTTYSLMYSNFVNDTCYASIDVYVDQPVFKLAYHHQLGGSDTLSAQATITAGTIMNLNGTIFLVLVPHKLAGQLYTRSFYFLLILTLMEVYIAITLITGGNAATASYLSV